jgi:hypothetical protein
VPDPARGHNMPPAIALHEADFWMQALTFGSQLRF